MKADRDESSPYAAMLAAQDVSQRCKVFCFFIFFKLLIVITMDCLFWDIISLVKFPCKPSSFVYMHSYVTIWICSLINVVIFRNLESLPFILNSVLLEGTRLRRQDLVLNLLSGPLPVQA